MNVLPLLPHQSDPGPRHHSVTRHVSRVITHHVSVMTWHHTSSHQWWFVTSIITCHAGHHMTSQMPHITGAWHHRSSSPHVTDVIVCRDHGPHTPSQCARICSGVAGIWDTDPSLQPSPVSLSLTCYIRTRRLRAGAGASPLPSPSPSLWAGPTLTLVTTLHHLNTNPRQAEDLDIVDLVSIQMQID